MSHQALKNYLKEALPQNTRFFIRKSAMLLVLDFLKTFFTCFFCCFDGREGNNIHEQSFLSNQTAF